jgi:hypothetical protein
MLPSLGQQWVRIEGNGGDERIELVLRYLRRFCLRWTRPWIEAAKYVARHKEYRAKDSCTPPCDYEVHS